MIGHPSLRINSYTYVTECMTHFVTLLNTEKQWMNCINIHTSSDLHIEFNNSKCEKIAPLVHNSDFILKAFALRSLRWSLPNIGLVDSREIKPSSLIQMSSFQ